MIFCEKLLFLHVPKAAGSSLAEVLLERLPRPTYYVHPDASSSDPRKGIVHIPGGSHENLAEAQDIIAGYGFNLARLGVILGVVRNPYEMEVSRYAYLRAGNPFDFGYNQALAFTSDFETFAVKSKPHGWLKRPIESYFTLDGATPPNMRILRMENLLEDLNPALEAADLSPVAELPAANASKHDHFLSYYTQRSEQAVFERYRWVFDQGFYPRLDANQLPKKKPASSSDALKKEGGKVSPAELATMLTKLAHDTDNDTRARIIAALLEDIGSARQAEVLGALSLDASLVAALGHNSNDREKAEVAASLLFGASEEAKQYVVGAFLHEATADEKANLAGALLASEPDFAICESKGLHLTRAHFYSPIPTLAEINEDVWDRESELVGIDLNVDAQLRLLQDVFPSYAQECVEFAADSPRPPTDFYFSNGQFDGTDAAVLYCMIRHLRPNLVFEVGSGFSTRLIAKALVRNATGHLVCVDPYPSEVVTEGLPGLTSLVVERIQNVDIDAITDLERDDVLFIDSSHVSRVGGDVNFLFLEVLPRLKPGVVVHVHDVFLPGEYPRDWVAEQHRFWNEQYLLQAFLQFNRAFEVILANSYLGKHHGDLFRETFPMAPWWGGGSFWMRRRQ